MCYEMVSLATETKIFLMKYHVIFLFLTLMVMSCNETKDKRSEIVEEDKAQTVIDESIEVSGGEAYEKFTLRFTFRDRNYISRRDGGNFEYTRVTFDSLNVATMDIYSNLRNFQRFINNEKAEIADTLAAKIENSINSVNYFVLLPYGLNDPAVNKSYLGTEIVKNKIYHKIKVTFEQDGGGKDFDDVYVYWINEETNKIDYLAYSYHVNGGGMRFREAYNERYVEGLRIVDYNNYKPGNSAIDLFDLAKSFENGELKLLSKIETESVSVNSRPEVDRLPLQSQ